MSPWKNTPHSALIVKVLVGAIGLVGGISTYMALSGVTLMGLVSFAPLETEQSKSVVSDARGSGLFSRYKVVMDSGETMSLAQGEYLVAMLSMSCEHCMASVAQLNEYVGLFPDIPVVALCWEPTEGAMAEFTAMSGPLFLMHSLGDNFMEFAELIGSAPPRLSYIRDGVAVRSWDDTMPNVESLIAEIESFRAPVHKKTSGN